MTDPRKPTSRPQGEAENHIRELDQAATAKMLAALATLYDPAASDIKKAHAERKRRAAVDKIFQAVDLGMTPAKGRA